MELLLSVMSVAIGLAGVGYAYMTNRAKTTLEKLIQAQLRGLAGNIKEIREQPRWANTHLETIYKLASKKEKTEEDLNEILQRAYWGRGDITAAERMLSNLLNEILTLQEGMFGTRTVKFPRISRHK